MKKILFRILPALMIGIAMIVSALIFERGMRDLANGLYNISHSVQEVASSAETMYQTVQDFPSFLNVDVSGSLQVWGDIGTY